MDPKFREYLKYMVENDASDLFLTTNAPPSTKLYGKMTPIPGEDVFPPGRVREIAESIMDEEQIADYAKKPECNLAISESGVGRFRVNVFTQRNQVAMVCRVITSNIPTLEQLNLPKVLGQLIMQKTGLILFVGGTGSGKSTSLAALINKRNTESAGHIITVEDPVEFVHKHKKSIISQREVGMDTLCYEDALINTLRQAPDVILIGEIRHRETMEHAIEFAETGHLCVSTLHANNANQALTRIINMFPEERHQQLFMDLSLNMRGIISQRLVPSTDGKRAAAIEILLNSPRVADLIKKGEVDNIKPVMEKSGNIGMQTFDMALYNLWDEERISDEEALKNADSKNNLALRMRLKKGVGDEGNDKFSMVSDDEDERALQEEENQKILAEKRAKEEAEKAEARAAAINRPKPVADGGDAPAAARPAAAAPAIKPAAPGGAKPAAPAAAKPAGEKPKIDFSNLSLSPMDQEKKDK